MSMAGETVSARFGRRVKEYDCRSGRMDLDNYSKIHPSLNNTRCDAQRCVKLVLRSLPLLIQPRHQGALVVAGFLCDHRGRSASAVTIDQLMNTEGVDARLLV